MQLTEQLTASVLVAQVGEPPHIAEAHTEADDGQEEVELAAPLLPLPLFALHFDFVRHGAGRPRVSSLSQLTALAGRRIRVRVGRKGSRGGTFAFRNESITFLLEEVSREDKGSILRSVEQTHCALSSNMTPDTPAAPVRDPSYSVSVLFTKS